MNNHRTVHQPPTPPPVPITPQVRDMVSLSADKLLADYLAAKLEQPIQTQLIFTTATGPTITHEFFGRFAPRSFVVSNPTTVPMYVSPGGTNPLVLGIPIEPQKTSPRFPVVVSMLTVGFNPADFDLTTADLAVWLFAYPLPD